MAAVVRVDVETQPDGGLHVGWELEGEPTAVDLSVGPTPDHVDHKHQTTVAAGDSSFVISDLGPGRHFVAVAPHGGGSALVAADRRVPFRGVVNFRDLGGYPTDSGGRTRWGMLFRADAPNGLSPEDLALYDQLGVRVVYDLRRDVEREERPNPMQSRPLAMIGRPRNENDGAPQLDAVTNGELFLRDLYFGLLDLAAEQLGELFTGLAQPDALPAMFHCHAGKDRTGVVAALLLEHVGADREMVLDDYELSSRYRVANEDPTLDRLLQTGMPPEAAASILSTPRWAMQEALMHLDEDYGGITSFLTGPAGVKESDLQALRTQLVA